MADGEDRIWMPEEILAEYRAGQRDFRGREIEERPDDASSFRSASLDGADFSRAFIVADFRNASLRGCKFVGANVKTCCFDEADLSGCDFSNAAIDAATFSGARLDGARFDGAGAYGYSFKPGELPS